jgi:alpha-glucosidase
MFFRSGGIDPGRDGCRVPLPWSDDRPPYGFSPAGSRRAWLDQPDGWAALTVAAESADPASMLSLYRDGLRLRRAEPELGDGELAWLPSASNVLAFTRGAQFACVVNFGPEPAELPSGATTLISSTELEGGHLPQDAAVWLRLPTATRYPTTKE